MKKYNKILVTAFILFIIGHCSLSIDNCKAQWVARYNGTANTSDHAKSIAVDDSGYVYVTGNSFDAETSSDYVTIKYSPSGDSVWVRRYGGIGNSYDEALSIAVDDSGNVFVTGNVGSISGSDFTTLKYNSAGALQWEAMYDGPANSIDRPSSIAVDHSGNTYVTGASTTTAGHYYDYATIKYNSSGDSVWVARYNGSSDYWDEPRSIAIDDSGNVYVTGTSNGIETMYDYATIKYNSEGDSVWVSRYNGTTSHWDQANSIALDGIGNVYVTGYSEGSGTYNDYITIKYNSSGDSVWVSGYNNGIDEAKSIAVDSSGNVYVTGFSGGVGTDLDYSTVKYDSTGLEVWVRRYNGTENLGDIAYSIALDESGNVYVTGTCNGYAGLSDYATIKYSAAGRLIWVDCYNGPGNLYDEACSIVLDKSDNVYVTGFSSGMGTGEDYATIKNPQLITDKKQVTSEIPGQFSLYQNYPNPFNPVTNLEFGISILGFVSLKVYDILGKEVVTLVNEKLSPGKYEVEFDGSGLPSGVYFYRLNAGESTDTKRMMLVK